MKNGMIRLVGITLSLSFFSVANITAMDCVEDCCNLCFCNLFALVDSHNVSNRTNRISSELNQAKKPSRAYLEKIEEFYEKSDYEESCDYNVLTCFEDPYFIRQRSSAYNDRLKFYGKFLYRNPEGKNQETVLFITFDKNTKNCYVNSHWILDKNSWGYNAVREDITNWLSRRYYVNNNYNYLRRKWGLCLESLRRDTLNTLNQIKKPERIFFLEKTKSFKNKDGKFLGEFFYEDPNQSDWRVNLHVIFSSCTGDCYIPNYGKLKWYSWGYRAIREQTTKV